jgi:hypothetical protein
MQARYGGWRRVSWSLSFCAVVFFASPGLLAQSSSSVARAELPDAPGAAQNAPSANTSVMGTVLDTDGAAVVGATVVLEDTRSHAKQTTKAADDGGFVFSSLAASTYRVTVTANGFSPFVATNVLTHVGESFQLPQIALEIAPLNTSVDAITQYQMAEIEMKEEEHQRVLWAVPNFYVVYNWHAAPLSATQKFRLALRTERDPFSFLGSLVVAGSEQLTNTYPGYGTGAGGFAKRYAASYADGFTGTMIGGALLPALFHQDPRYFYKGTGSITSRALYAISTVVICRGDNGKWKPNYSSILGDLASAGISNAYYPASDRHGATVVIDNSLVGTAFGAFSSLMQEFLLRHVMLGTAPPPRSAPLP